MKTPVRLSMISLLLLTGTSLPAQDTIPKPGPASTPPNADVTPTLSPSTKSDPFSRDPLPETDQVQTRPSADLASPLPMTDDPDLPASEDNLPSDDLLPNDFPPGDALPSDDANLPESSLTLKVYKLRHAEAVDTLILLTELVPELRVEGAIAADERTNSIVARTTNDRHETISQLLEATDVNDASATTELRPSVNRKAQRGSSSASAAENPTRDLLQQLTDEVANAGNELDRKVAIDALKDAITESFDARQDQQIAEVRELSERLADLSRQIQERQSRRQAIIEKRLQELLASTSLHSDLDRPTNDPFDAPASDPLSDLEQALKLEFPESKVSLRIAENQMLLFGTVDSRQTAENLQLRVMREYPDAIIRSQIRVAEPSRRSKQESTTDTRAETMETQLQTVARLAGRSLEIQSLLAGPVTTEKKLQLLAELEQIKSTAQVYFKHVSVEEQTAAHQREFAEEQLTQAQALHEKEAISQQELRTAELRMKEAEATHKQHQQMLEVLKSLLQPKEPGVALPSASEDLERNQLFGPPQPPEI